MKLTGSVRSNHHDRGFGRSDAPYLGNRDRELTQHLQQECLELVVGAVEFVDQQDRAGARSDRVEEWALDQEGSAEEVVDRLALGLGRADGHQLARVVPVVQGLGRVDALVALQTDEPAIHHLRQDLCDLGLADAGLALQQQRPVERHGQVYGDREASVGQVGVGAQTLL